MPKRLVLSHFDTVSVNLAEKVRMATATVKRRKRKRTMNTKYYSPPWRTDNMNRHLQQQHNVRYEEYVKLDRKTQSKYFEEVEDARPFAASSLRKDGVSLKAKENVSFAISKSIVKVVIHQLLLEFDPDEEDVDISNLAIFSAIENEEGEYARPSAASSLRKDGVSLKAKENISFTISESIVEVVIHQLLLEFDPDEEDVDISNLAIFSAIENEEGVEYYEVSWSNKLLFEMIVSYVSVGISFRQCARLLRETRETTGLGCIGIVSVGKVIQVVRNVVGFNLETIKSVLHDVWAFSLKWMLELRPRFLIWMFDCDLLNGYWPGL